MGAAIGRNPLSIIVPCHRVIGSNGKLTGFAGGVETKAALLKLESDSHATAPPSGKAFPSFTTSRAETEPTINV